MRRLLVACGWAACLVGSVCAHAQSLYQHSLSLSSGLTFDSNPRLDPEPSGSAYKLRLSPRYGLTRKAGADEFKLKLGTVVEQSSNTTLSRHRRDGDAQLEWHRESAAMLYGLRAGYEQSDARAALLEETGQLSADGTRRTRWLGATVSRQLDARHAVVGFLDAKWNRYDFGNAPDHRLVSAGWEWSRTMAEGQEWFVLGSLARYAPDTPGEQMAGASSPAEDSQQRGLMLGVRSKVPGTSWDWLVRAGVVQFNGPFSDTTAQAEARLGYQGLRWNTALAMSRLPVANNTLGSFATHQQARVRTEYALTEFTQLALDATHNRTTSTQTETAWVVGLQLSSEISPWWRVTAQVKRTEVNRNLAAGDMRARSNGASLVFHYSHPDF